MWCNKLRAQVITFQLHFTKLISCLQRETEKERARECVWVCEYMLSENSCFGNKADQQI